jgi:hypothetical protein
VSVLAALRRRSREPRPVSAAVHVIAAFTTVDPLRTKKAEHYTLRLPDRLMRAVASAGTLAASK